MLSLITTFGAPFIYISSYIQSVLIVDYQDSCIYVSLSLSNTDSLSLLSCGHFLHVVCIEALERFASEGTLPLCPLCRAPYQRIGIGHKLE